MSGKWAVLLPRDKAAGAAALRLWPGIRICDAGDELWLAGEEMSDDLRRELCKLPGGRRFDVSTGGAITPEGARVPTGKLPDAGWTPLAQFIALAPQPAAIAGSVGRRTPVHLIRTGREEPATVLVTRFEPWQAYALSAPLVRLRALRFAVAGDDRTLLRGAPLPPLAGTRYVEREGIAIPCGFALSPAVDPATLRGLLETTPGDLALFDEQGGWERIDANDFQEATPRRRPRNGDEPNVGSVRS